MDVKDIKIKKDALESVIMNILNSFEIETGVDIYNIKFDRATEIGKKGSFIYLLELDIRL